METRTITNQLIITDNAEEKISVSWDGKRFAVIHEKYPLTWSQKETIILNPKEMLDLVRFSGTLGRNE